MSFFLKVLGRCKCHRFVSHSAGYLRVDFSVETLRLWKLCQARLNALMLLITCVFKSEEMC